MWNVVILISIILNALHRNRGIVHWHRCYHFNSLLSRDVYIRRIVTFHFWNYPNKFLNHPKKFFFFFSPFSPKDLPRKISPNFLQQPPTSFPLIVKQKILEKHPKSSTKPKKMLEDEWSRNLLFANLLGFQVNLSRRIGDQAGNSLWTAHAPSLKFKYYILEVASDDKSKVGQRWMTVQFPASPHCSIHCRGATLKVVRSKGETIFELFGNRYVAH